MGEGKRVLKILTGKSRGKRPAGVHLEEEERKDLEIHERRK